MPPYLKCADRVEKPSPAEKNFQGLKQATKKGPNHALKVRRTDMLNLGHSKRSAPPRRFPR